MNDLIGSAVRGAILLSARIAMALTLVLSAASGQAPSPPAPNDVIASHTNPRAATLFRAVASNPAQAEPRHKLARFYQSMKYQRLSEFFDMTADFLAKKQFRLKTPTATPQWGCPEPSVGGKSSRALATEIAETAGGGVSHSVEVLEAAEAALRSNGFSCFVVGEWSRAVLHNAVAPEPKVTWDSRELAVRQLLTLGDEVYAYPIGLEGQASVYHFLSEYFSLTGDYVSAYVAAVLARERLKAGSATGAVEKGSFGLTLEESIQRLRKAAERQRE